MRCGRRHTTQTFFVDRLPRRVVGDPAEPRTRAIAAYVTPRCDRRLARWLGGDPATRALARLHAVWFLPSGDGLARGARWYRCDVAAPAGNGRLAPLPRDTADLLADPAALATYGRCSRGSPESGRSTPVTCGRAHDWRAFDALRLAPGRGSAYPSRDVLRDARGRCREAARAELGYPLEWRYGWEAPDRRAWATGVRWGLCWVPEA